MNLGALILKLRPLVANPIAHRDEIEELLADHRHLAEYEVARFYVARHLPIDPEIEHRLRSQDPRERVRGVRSVTTRLPRSRAARLLRLVIKDPDPTTRSAARRAVRRLSLNDVALPDTRFHLRPRATIRRMTPGAWNPSGWSFGIFNRTVRTRTRPEELARTGLPHLGSPEALAALLGLTAGDAVRRLQRPGTGTGSPYVEFQIQKATGGRRAIAAPRAPLRRVQRIILREILDRVPPHDAAHGFVKGRSTVTNATPHQRTALLVKMDLADFFPSIHFRRVAGLFESLGYGAETSKALASLCTYRPVLADGTVAWPGVLPQGAPTSPAIANLVCRRLDARLVALAAAAGAGYTRYADDLTFSFVREPENLGRFLWWVDQICQQEGFAQNWRKRRVLRRKTQQRVTGIIVNEGMTVPREDRRRFRALLCNIRRNGLAAEKARRPDLEGYLQGFAAYVRMVQPELGRKLVAEVRAVLSVTGSVGTLPITVAE